MRYLTKGELRERNKNAIKWKTSYNRLYQFRDHSDDKTGRGKVFGIYGEVWGGGMIDIGFIIFYSFVAIVVIMVILIFIFALKG